MSDRFKAPALPGKMKDPLSLKVPSNPKYQDVRPTVDTGASMTKYLERVREIKSNYKYKKGELFKRIKVTTLVGLMIKVAEINEEQSGKTVDDDVTTSASDAATEAPQPSRPSPDIGATSDAHQPSRPSSSSSRPSSFLGSTSEGILPSRPSSSSRCPSVDGAASEASNAAPTPPPNAALTPPPNAAFMPPPAMSTRSSRSKRSEPIVSSSLPFFPHPSSLRRSADSVGISSSSSSSYRPPTSYSRSGSSLQGLIGGIGERTTSPESVEENKENSPTNSSLEPPYLLVDIREEDAFKSGHLRTAINFPSSRLSRATNFETKELRSFRNGEGKVIVVYDEDETMAPRAADILVQRGYDNVFLLSGGINVAEKFFPGGLLWNPKASSSHSTPSASTAATPLTTTPPKLRSEEIVKLQSQLEEAQKAASPAHRPTVKTSFDRRRTQMIGGQFKQKKTVPKPIW